MSSNENISSAPGNEDERPLRPQSTARLDIDLEALGSNYDQLAAMAPGAECGAVVKADGYGTGASQAAACLLKRGCRSFFVATIDEGREICPRLEDTDIFVLDGLFAGTEELFACHDLIPVLGSLEEIRRWGDFCKASGHHGKAALHIDTGMNRLGVGPDQLPALIEKQQDLFEHFSPGLIMSHLACADEPGHPRNPRQLKLFREVLGQLPPAPASLANSAGIFLGREYHFDLLRPGIALYGGRAVNGVANPMRPVVHLKTPIIQIRQVAKGDAIGYGASYIAPRPMRTATIPVGYADGYLRALGGSNGRNGANVWINGHKAKLAGRVSMDLITVDISDLPQEEVKTGTMAEIIGTHVTVDDLADIAGTIGYEILTSLGQRHERHYHERHYVGG